MSNSEFIETQQPRFLRSRAREMGEEMFSVMARGGRPKHLGLRRLDQTMNLMDLFSPVSSTQPAGRQAIAQSWSPRRGQTGGCRREKLCVSSRRLVASSARMSLIHHHFTPPKYKTRPSHQRAAMAGRTAFPWFDSVSFSMLLGICARRVRS